MVMLSWRGARNAMAPAAASTGTSQRSIGAQQRALGEVRGVTVR